MESGIETESTSELDRGAHSSSPPSTEPEALYIYFVSRHCGLCGFKIIEGDDVIAAKSDGSVSHTSQHTFKPCSDDGEVLEYSSCKRPIPHVADCFRDEHATGCHLTCFKTSSSLPRHQFIKAFEPTFELSPLQQSQRKQWLQRRLASHLLLTFCKLPIEILHQIAGYFVCEYAVAIADSVWKKRQEASTEFTISAPIRAMQTSIEGSNYIASLTNVVDGIGANVPHLSASVNVVYLQEDQLGVRRVLLTNSADSLPPIKKARSVW
ncbi:hypothetical protein PT974_01610 [Cladobotryum mycophilum]|uniref:Uncharacterized protein n=1 Tax=Cladobotryum mycophilum TaxID=491253 RepID=A0ABR0T4G6_9HYPO